MHNKRPRYDLMEYKRREFLTALSPQSHPSNPDFNPSATEMKKDLAYLQENMLSCPVR